MDALERLGEHGAHAEERGAFRGPVAAAALAIVAPAQHDGGDARFSVGAAASCIGTISRIREEARVMPPSTPGTSKLRMRTLAKVPRTITS